MGRVIQIVGYQNSGKTTFAVDYINSATKLGLKVGTIKHHGHSGKIQHDDVQKDTGKHRDAGAIVTLVEGNGSMILHSDSLTLSLPELILLYSHFKLDVILVEGYKAEKYPKIVLIRSTKDVYLLSTVTNVLCIYSEIELPNEIGNTYKLFTNQSECINWLITNEAGESID